jgi:hypothetical protein
MSVTFFGPSLRALQKKKRYDNFMQDGATENTATYSTNVLNKVLEED